MELLKSSYCNNYNIGACSSCKLIASDYQSQINFKFSELEQLFTSLDSSTDKISNVKISDFVTLDQPLGSRYKAKFYVTGTTDVPVIGYADAAGNIYDLVDCPLQTKLINKILFDLKTELGLSRLPPYSIQNRSGEVKGFHIKQSYSSNDVIIRLVLRSRDNFEDAVKVIDKLVVLNPEIKIGTINIQPEHKAILEGVREEIVYKESNDWIEEQIGGVNLMVSPQVFTQVTPYIANLLYLRVASWIKELKITKVLDLYCGIGGFSLPSSLDLQSLSGYEISAEAVNCANRALARYRTDSRAFYQLLDIDNELENLTDSFDLAILNPPRRGVNDRVISFLNRVKYPYIIYSSCNAKTLVRDIKNLNSYSVQKIIPFDMFPFTTHYETLVLLKAI